jgi:DNA-binding XRE family transcriptional regulator
MSSVSHIYVIAAGDKTVKVGIARDPEKRCGFLQVGHHTPLEIAFTKSCEEKEARLVEQFTHRLLKEKHLRGEWFNVTVEEAKAVITEAIERVRAGEPLPPSRLKKAKTLLRGRPPVWPAQARMARAATGLTLREVATAIKINPNTITRIESGKDAMGNTLKKIREFYESKGIEFSPDGGVRLVKKAG